MHSPEDIIKAYYRISSYIKKTPILTSTVLNESLGNHDICFKAENTQVTGAFKVRGVLNTILKLKENNITPEQIIAYSSGNHAQAIAWAGKKFGIKAKLYMTNFSSPIKMQAVIEHGAELVTTRTRIEAETKSYSDSLSQGNFFLHPSDNEDVIDGAATLCYESLLEMDTLPDAIFAACGGGALLSGTFLATKIFSKNIEVFGAEPKSANDASMSYKAGKIIGFTESPKTIADGARTLKLSERTFKYIKQVSGIYEITEDEIIYWTAWINHLLKTNCEPTSALPMAAAHRWLRKQKSKKKILILLSGGNTDQESLKKVWKKNHLDQMPSLIIN